ncbi:MAG: response regulator [Gemmatimonadaceae bacterium]|nr:response regulator [Gemmatimonadaceae bacterium]
MTDNGVGMSREIAQQSLEPFFTTKPVGSGSGLGLSMVYGFVKQSGGNLKIYSEPGVGTSVQLYLPATDARSTGTKAPAADVPRASSDRAEVIVIVEDDTNVRLFCVRCLTSLGYTTIEAANGPAALEALAAAPQVDLLLTDVVMPNGLNGPAVAAEAQRLRPGLRVLFMSGYPAHMLDVGDELSVAHLLTKPFSRAMLAHTIRSLLDGAPVASVAHVRH